MLAELANRPHTDFIICDPKMMDFSWLWGERALWIAEGPDEAARATALVFDEMKYRRSWGSKHRLREITPGVEHDPDRCDVCQRYGWSTRSFSYLHLVVDEMADIVLGTATFERDGKKVRVSEEFHRHTQQIAGTGRACAIGQTLCTQSPKATVVPMLTRENCRVRLCFRTEEPEQTDAILGSMRIPAHTALTLKGECFGKQDSSVTRWRGWWASDAQLEDVIAASAHYRSATPPTTMEVTT
jgi:DNA segregation ATPase FtsK/SpoIIIE-like protein